MQQQYFNNSYADISTSGSKIVTKGIFSNDSEAAKILGFDKLKQETSVNASAGFTLKPLNNLTITIDGYWIKVKDRVVITSNITDKRLDQFKVESGRFFANAIDTETKGVDVVVSYDWILGNGKLNLNLAETIRKQKSQIFIFLKT